MLPPKSRLSATAQVSPVTKSSASQRPLPNPSPTLRLILGDGAGSQVNTALRKSVMLQPMLRHGAGFQVNTASRTSVMLHPMLLPILCHGAGSLVRLALLSSARLMSLRLFLRPCKSTASTIRQESRGPHDDASKLRSFAIIRRQSI